MLLTSLFFQLYTTVSPRYYPNAASMLYSNKCVATKCFVQKKSQQPRLEQACLSADDSTVYTFYMQQQSLIRVMLS